VLGRRSILRMAASAALAPLTGSVSQAVASVDTFSADAAGRPDIVILMTDDMRDSDWDRGLPKTRALLEAQGATWFPNFFLTTPVCSPSRASILTGMYPHNHGIEGDVTNRRRSRPPAPFNPRPLADDTIAYALNRSGYRTGLVGKFFKGFAENQPVPAGWSSWVSTVTQSYTGFALNHGGSAKTYKGSRYSTDVLRNAAVQFVRTTPRTKPLFLYFTPTAPHTPLKPAKRHQGRFNGAQVDLDPEQMAPACRGSTRMTSPTSRPSSGSAPR